MATESWRRNHSHVGHGVNVCTLVMSERRCVGCDQRLAQVLVDDDPDVLTHPCCDEVATWLRTRAHQPVLRWSRR